MDAMRTGDEAISEALKGKDFCMEEYLRTIFDEKLMIKVPESEDKNLTTSTKLLEKHKQIARLNEELLARKEEFRVKMQYVQQRREEFEKKECQLKESLMKFDKFFKENDDKRMRALKKLAFERGLQRQKQKEIAALKSGNESLKEKKQKLENRMKYLVKYRDFLEATVKGSDDFNEISEVITRYEALSANLEDLKSTDQANNEIAESLNVDLHQYKEEKEEEKLTLTNELVDLRKMLEKYQAESRSRESIWEHSKNAEAKRISKLNTLKSAVNNMYRLVRMYQRYGDEAQENDLKGQLAVIEDFILDVDRITKEVKLKAKKVES